MRVYVVIDVEMCRVCTKHAEYPCKNEIIQIGAVMMDEAYKIKSKFSAYVKPRYGKIDYSILTLTGISERTIKDAPDIEKALEQMLDWIGDTEVVFYSWSEMDYNQIRKEIQLKCHDNARWETLLNQMNWIDYQKKLGDRLESFKLLKLTEALELVEINIEGRIHNGLDDAFNTARMISKLESHKDYRTILEKFREREKEQKPLTISLGSLLQGLVLEPA